MKIIGWEKLTALAVTWSVSLFIKRPSVKGIIACSIAIIRAGKERMINVLIGEAVKISSRLCAVVCPINLSFIFSLFYPIIKK